MTKEIGTLKELNVKPGDVVSYYLGAEYVVAEGNRLTHPDGKTQPYNGWDTVAYFSIISRASEAIADTPKLWKDMTPEEKGALLLAHHEGKEIQQFIRGTSGVTYWTKTCKVVDPEFAYRVKPEPVVETVELSGRDDTVGDWSFGTGKAWPSDTHRITFDLIDGKPDCNSIKMESL